MKYIPLKDICSINMGQSPDSKSYNYNKDGLPFFQGNADFGERYPITRVWCNDPTKIAHAGDILISVRAPIGALNYAKEDCCIGRGLAALTPDSSRLSPDFLYWLLYGKTDELNSSGTGTTFKAISRKVLEETPVPDIALWQQAELSGHMERIYGIIKFRKQQLAKLDELVKARFVEMFGDPEYNSKCLPIQTLDRLCTIGSSKRIYQNEQSSSGVPFWRVSDLVSKMDTGFCDSGLFISKEKYEELNRGGFVPVTGDILITSRGTLGRCYIVKNEDVFYFQDGMISWLNDYADSITPTYLQYLFTMPGFKKQIDSMQAGSTVAYLSIAMLKRLQIMVPNKDTQIKFAAFAAQVEKSKAAVQSVLDKAQLFFDSLMQKYFG